MKTKLTLLLSSAIVLTGCAQLPTSSSATSDSHVSTSTTTKVESTESTQSSSSTSTEKLPDTISFDDNEAISYFRNQNEKSEMFLKKGINYEVGDDNAFKLNPVGLAIGSTVTSYKLGYDVTFYKKVDNEFVKFSENDTSLYIEKLDKKDVTIDFTEKAVGQVIKVEYVPSYIPESQKSSITPLDLVIEVRDGYNVTNPNELAYINNDKGDIPCIGELPVNIVKANVAWNEFKEAKGLKQDYYPAGIFLHNKITVTTENFPEAYLINETEDSEGKYGVGLNDHVNIYHRVLEEITDTNKKNNSFRFGGNFFEVNAEAIPVVKLEGNEEKERDFQVSHAQLFRFSRTNASKDYTSSVNFENVLLRGNAGRQEDEDLSGGLIMVKVDDINFKFYNCRTLQWFISFFGEESKQPMLVDSCYATDSFNTFVYAFGCEDFTIRDSKLLGAGGPCLIQDHVQPSWTEGVHQYITNMKIENSQLESFVTGNEGWFKTMKADALVPTVKSLNLLLNGLFKTSFLYDMDKKPFFNPLADEGLLQTTQFNLLAINKSGEMEAPTPDFRVKGGIEFVDDVRFDYGTDNYDSTIITDKFVKQALTDITATPADQIKEAPYLLKTNGKDASNNNGYLVLKPTSEEPFKSQLGGFMPLDPTTGNDADGQRYGGLHAMQDNVSGMTGGDKIALYFWGMMFLFGYTSIK